MCEFQSSIPPLPDTYSFRRRPCLFEQPVLNGTDTYGDCPYRRECDGATQPLLLGNAEVYGRRIKTTLAEPSSTIVVRSEHHYNKDERRRLSLRKHFYETTYDQSLLSDEIINDIERHLRRLHDRSQNNDNYARAACFDAQFRQRLTAQLQAAQGTADPDIPAALNGLGIPAESADLLDLVVEFVVEHPLRCSYFSDDARFARYLGFIDLRLSSDASTIAMALLVPPRALRHDSAVRVVMGEYGQIFGAHPFASTVYSMHDPEVSGAACAQASAIMALATLSDRGANVLGSYTLTCLANTGTTPGTNPSCLGRENGTEALAVRGLRVDEMRDLLNKEECGTSSATAIFKDTAELRTRLGRLIEGYVTARCPTILFLNGSKWWKKEIAETGHAVMIAGIRYGRPAGPNSYVRELSDLIVHDPGYVPFMQRTFEESVSAALDFESTPEFESGPEFFEGLPFHERIHNEISYKIPNPRYQHIHMLMVADKKIHTHANQCLDRMDQMGAGGYDEDFFLWMTCSLEPLRQELGANYHVRLTHRDDVVTRLMSLPVLPYSNAPPDEDATRQRLEALRSRLQKLPNAWYWALERFELIPPDEFETEGERKGPNDRLRCVWLFNAETDLPPVTPWACKIEVDHEGQPQLQFP